MLEDFSQLSEGSESGGIDTGEGCGWGGLLDGCNEIVGCSSGGI